MRMTRGFLSTGLLFAILFLVLSFGILGYEVRAKLGEWWGQATSTKEEQDASQFLHTVAYEVDAGTVYYRRIHDPETVRQPLSGVDVATFSVLKTPDGTLTSFAKDAHQIYFPATYFSQSTVSIARFTTADPATFSIIGAPNMQGPNAIVFLKDKDKVFYAHQDFKTGNVVIDPITQADPATFALVPDASGQGNLYYFTKDKNHVYFVAPTGAISVVPNADPTTFALITSVKASGGVLFWKDRRAVYYLHSNSNNASGQPEFATIPADPTTLALVYDSRGQETKYLKDANTVFYIAYELGTVVAVVRGADPATFHVNADPTSGEELGVDGAHVYIATSTVPYADPASFANVATGYYKDAKHVYYGTSVTAIQPIAGADPATFALLSINTTGNIRRGTSSFSRDAAHVYWQGKLVEGANPNSFALLPDETGRPSNYYRDAAHVFYENDNTIVLIPGSDAMTFVILDTYAHLAKDTHAVYDGNRILPIDAHTFVPLTDTQRSTTGYWKDATHVYYLPYEDDYGDMISATGLTAVAGADPVTFEAYGDIVGCGQGARASCEADAKDKNHLYLYGQVVMP